MNNQLKIISGKFKSRLIKILDKKSLKPTKSYIRESLFSTIDIKNCQSSLDLFMGSAILSFEALSRGVKEVTVVEKDRDLINSVYDNLKKLDTTFQFIINTDALTFIKNQKRNTYDLIFLDPPYNSNLLDKVLISMKNYDFLKNNKYLFYECLKNDKKNYQEHISDTHDVIKDLSIGDVRYTISKRR